MTTRERLRLLYLAPLVVAAHVAEEGPRFLEWFNRHAEPDLTHTDFLAINAMGLLVTTALAFAGARSRSYPLALGLIAWLSFVLPANGLLHLTASFVLGEYVPGTVTAGVLYLPYFVAAIVTICRHRGVRPHVAALAATLGAVPMAAQGISILAVGRRMLW